MPRVGFDELGLWVFLTDLEDGPASSVEIPVGWPQTQRGRLVTRLDAPVENAGVIRVRGDFVVEVTRPGGADMGWETLSLWDRGAGYVEISNITKVRFQGRVFAAELVLWELDAPPAPASAE